MENKKVFITGITGMTGSHLAELLLAEGAEVHGTHRWSSNTRNIDKIKDKLFLHPCDLTDYSNIFHILKEIGPEYVFHLAAQSFVSSSFISPNSTLVDNIVMQLNILESIRELKIDPVIQLALSSEEYGLVYENELPVTEESPFRPLSPYAVSKVTQDMMGYQYAKTYGLKIIRTRTFNHTGPRRGEMFVTSNFAQQIAKIEKGLQEPVISVGNLDARRDWLDVRDVSKAYVIGAKKCIPSEVYLISSGKGRSIREMLDMLLTLTDVKVEVEIDKNRMRPSDIPVLYGNSAKFIQTTGWKPEIPFTRTLKDLLDYWREIITK